MVSEKNKVTRLKEIQDDSLKFERNAKILPQSMKVIVLTSMRKNPHFSFHFRIYI